MALITIPGKEDRASPDSVLSGRKTRVVTVNQVRTYHIQSARAADAKPLTLEAADDDVVAIELEGGIRLWTSVKQLRQDFPAATARGKKSQECVVPASLLIGTPSRGFAGFWLLKTLQVMKVDVPGEAAHLVAEKVENLLRDGPGLYRCERDQFALEPVSHPETLSGSKPLLLFIHGTASSTEGSFGGLWEPQQAAVKKGLLQPYDRNVLAFEHRTLSQSPAQNALEIVQLLPQGARLHLITHSRGGLVGELLCRGRMDGGRKPFDDVDLELFRRPGRESDLKAFRNLNRALAAKQIRVERFVRVACPARGTTLASGRLDRYFSVFINLLEQIPGLKGNPVYDVVTELLLTVIKKRTDPKDLPGLEAMMPESPLIALLNRPGVKTDADLRVVAGDIEGAGIWEKLKVLATDLFYLDDHDLVVNTVAMFGGTERVSGSGFFFCRGPEVNHFSYFRNSASAQKVVDGVTRREGEGDGFTPFSVEEAKEEGRVYRGMAERPRPVVFILPGIMGSHLAIKNDRVWINLVDLAVGGLSKLKDDAPGVQPEALVASAYSGLIQYLSQTHKVVPFPYDWRRSIREEARRLAQAIAAELDEVEENGQPVRIVAHSMGGLLARTMVLERPDVWKRICQHSGGRLLMLGTPNGGSFVIPRLLLGRERLMRQLALLDLRHSQRQLLDIVSRYPGLLEMLPSAGDYEFFSDKKWQELFKADGRPKDTWVVPGSKQLSAARDLRKELDASPVETGRMLYVAGSASATPVEVSIDASVLGSQRIAFLASPQGDGRVSWASGILPGLKAWYIPAEHGDLADYQPAYAGFLDLLQSGDTTRLSATPPALRGVPDRFPLPAEEAVLYPDQTDVTAAALGSRRRISKPKTKHQVHVTVTHGNLGYARYVVALGHYEGDTIISAEDHLDRVLEGRLRNRLQLGIYPGAEGTSEIFLNPNGKPSGALIIGLGQVGKLTPGSLTKTLTRGILSYAATRVEAQPTKGGASQPANLSTLLIGTGAGGISLEDSVVSVLKAVDLACMTLQKSGRSSGISIDHLEFVELYEDRAIQAGRALQIATADPALRERFVIDPYVVRVPGGRRRATYQESPGWWQRMQISEENNGSLRFTALTERARAEVSLQPTQRALVDQFVEQAVGKTDADDQVAVTLFNLLVPNSLKDHAPDRRDLVLVLDEGAARYPWELMQERPSKRGETSGVSDSAVRPLAVQAGLIRQLSTDTFRENVRATSSQNVLVIGDPKSEFPELPQAESEAREVAQTLRGRGYSVTEVVRETSDIVLNALYARDYRVLHLAGHGVYEYGESARKITGMVLGDNTFLTPVEINQMRVVPDLVFINCCYLGRTEDQTSALRRNRSSLAANISTQLIRMGVRAVIAAGWAVNDEAAETFATQFYNALFEGQPFGKAVQQARCVTYENHPTVNTWGAYQCYGDHDFTLAQGERPVTEGGGPKYSTPVELLVELENIAEDAATASSARVKQLRKRLDDIMKTIPQKWLGSGDVRAFLGRAFGEIDCFEEAIEHYRAATVAEKAQYPVRALEQLSNLQVRWAARSGTKGAGRIIKEAKRRLVTLNSLGETAERMSLLGSACKRQSMIEHNSAGKRRALQEMGRYYQRALDISLERAGVSDPYYSLNTLVVQVLSHALDRRIQLPADLQGQLEGFESAANRKNESEPNFWSEIVPAECLLVRSLAAGSLDKNQAEIVSRYQRAQTRGASSREFRSVLEHLDFLLSILESLSKKQQHARQIKALEVIRDRLAAGEN
jgi:pimeloyl-ACP methyl ester carboxylesterase